MEMAVVWLGILLGCLAIEIITLGLTTIWFAIGALAATIVSMFGVPFWGQFTLFIVVSFVFLIFTRPVAVKYFNKDRVKTNVESMIGKQAIVISEIDNLQGIGQVSVGGMEWSARAESENGTFPMGAVVVITDVQGVKLIVKENH